MNDVSTALPTELPEFPSQGGEWQSNFRLTVPHCLKWQCVLTYKSSYAWVNGSWTRMLLLSSSSCTAIIQNAWYVSLSPGSCNKTNSVVWIYETSQFQFHQKSISVYEIKYKMVVYTGAIFQCNSFLQCYWNFYYKVIIEKSLHALFHDKFLPVSVWFVWRLNR